MTNSSPPYRHGMSYPGYNVQVLAELHQKLIANLVPEVSVEFFKMIDIQHDEPERPFAPLGPAQFPVPAPLPLWRGKKPGQRVAHRLDRAISPEGAIRPAPGPLARQKPKRDCAWVSGRFGEVFELPRHFAPHGAKMKKTSAAPCPSSEYTGNCQNPHPSDGRTPRGGPLFSLVDLPRRSAHTARAN